MQTVTFYSYKGGVGRSLTLSNMAKKLLEYDVDVFVIDFDLEAPGLTYKFKEEINGTDTLEKEGVVDYINYFQDHDKLPERLSDYYTELESTKGGKGKLYLMTAGQFKKPDYWDKLSAINWVKLFEKDGDGVPLLLDLKGRIKNEIKPKVLLIDSRTGVTASASITLKLLADKCVILAVNNDENLEGANVVLQSLVSLDLKVRPEISFVLSRIPYHNNDEVEKAREATLLTTIRDQYFSKLDAKQFKYFGIIHHEREQGWKEEHRLGLPQEKQDFLTLDYLQLFESLFSDITEAERLRKEKQVASLLEQAFLEDDIESRMSLFDKALEIDAKNVAALQGRAFVYSELQRWDDAIADSSVAMRTKPNDAAGHYVHGVILFRRGRKDNSEELLTMALECFEKATALKPDFGDALFNSGTTLVHLSKAKKNPESQNLLMQAFGKFEKAVAISSSDFEAYNSLGAVLVDLASMNKSKEQELLQQALENFKKAVQINHAYHTAHFNLAANLGQLANAKRGKEAEALFQEAFTRYEIVAKLQPNFGAAYSNWGILLGYFAKMKDGTEAERLYRIALEKLQKAIELGESSYNLACYHAIKGEKKDAFIILENCLENKEITSDYVHSDEDWLTFKDDPEFRQLLEKYRDASSGH